MMPRPIIKPLGTSVSGLHQRTLKRSPCSSILGREGRKERPRAHAPGDTGGRRDAFSFSILARPSPSLPPSNPAASLAAALLVSLSSLLLSLAPPPPPASASLLELPASKLQNSYWLVRAGESVSEADGRVDTNRATKQATGAGLSDRGKRQVAEGALPLVAREACGGGCFVYYGTVRRSEQIAAAIGAAAGLSQSRLIPEFSFLDPRGLGALEGGKLAVVADEVSAGDASSPLYRPPMGTTGTPNESLSDVLMRVTQLVSAEETKHRGEDVVIVFPDAALPGAFQAAVLGEDLRVAESLAPPPGGAMKLRLAPSSSPRQQEE